MSNYAIVAGNTVIQAPVLLASNYKGIQGFHLLTEDQRRAHGWVPCDILNEVYDPDTHDQNPPVLSFDGERVTCEYQVVPKPVDAVRIIFKQKVDEERQRREALGLEYEFPTATGRVQTSREVDVRNVLAIVMTASVLKAQSVTGSVIPFRDEGNVTHMLTPDEALAMGLAVQQHIASQYQWAWGVKELIDAAETSAEVQAVWQEALE